MIRGGGDPNTAMALKPCPEWARRLGASPQKRIVASWSGSRMDPTEYKVAARASRPSVGSPSDQLYRTSNNEGHRVAVILDTKVLIQGCVKTCTRGERAELFSLFSSFDDDWQSASFLIQRNRDKLSTRKFDVGVFTQPGSKSDIAPVFINMSGTNVLIDNDHNQA